MTKNYEDLGRQVGALVDVKQRQYGDSFGKAGQILAVLYPNGVSPDGYKDLLAIVRIIDKLFRLANGAQGNESPGKDIAGYGLLIAASAPKKPQGAAATESAVVVEEPQISWEEFRARAGMTPQKFMREWNANRIGRTVETLELCRHAATLAFQRATENYNEERRLKEMK